MRSNFGQGLRLLRSSVLAFIGLLMVAFAAQAQLTVYSSGTLAAGESRQLTAYVPLEPNTVTWSVNGITGGNATVGTVSPTGLYTAPTVIPMPNAVSVRATSTAFPSQSDAVTMTITQTPVHLWSISPTSVAAGPFTITLNGSNFRPDAVVSAGKLQLTTTFRSATSLTATGEGPASRAGFTFPVTVTNPGLGGTVSETVNLTVRAGTPTAVTVTVSPSSASVNTGATRQFTAAVTGNDNTAVTWQVNGMAGGNATLGTVSASGLYTAPAAVPMTNPVTVQAVSVASSSAVGSASVTLTATQQPGPVTVGVTPSSATLAPGATQSFAATVSGTANTAVTWSVDGIAGGNATVGTIAANGVYTAPAAAPTPATVTVRATSVASPATSATAAVTIATAGQGTAKLAAGRLLEQGAFGPTPSELTRVASLGAAAWIDEQLVMPETAIATPADNGIVRSQYLNRLSVAPDQLRQRVAYALGQIFVVSMEKNPYPNEVVPYLQILSRHAFGNYRNLMGEITISPQMGKYLDLANSNKPTAGSSANENYARELLQLFSIGLVQLNADGTPKLDAQSRPIPAYDQATVQQLALALTGWTYAGPQANNWENFSGPMQPRDVNHDMRAKSFLGCNLASNQSTTVDMNATLDCVFNHPNVGPFVALRLIRSMVTSNPSPAYVQRVAAVFDNNGSGVRGDLRATVRALLLDAEARNDTATPNSGRLRDPVGHAVALVRGLGGSMSATNGSSYLFGNMGQMPLASPSVFSFYSPLFRIPHSSLAGPEFQIYTPTESVLRGNLFWAILSNPGSDFPLSIAPYVAVAGDTNALIDKVDQSLLYGRMPPAMRAALATAINAQYDNTGRAQTALYLTVLSGLYAVQH